MCCHITVCYKEEFLKFNIWNQFIQAAQEGVPFIKSELEFVCFSRFSFIIKFKLLTRSPSETLNSIPYVSTVLQKNNCRITPINPFHATDTFRYPLKMFSGGIERDQWHEMG